MASRCMPAYSVELVRLGSFSNWPHFDTDMSLSPRAFTKAGLYYSGIDDVVTCFSCGKSFRDWAVGEDPVVKHFEGSPGCDFIRDLFLAQNNAASSSDSLDVNENYASNPTAIVRGGCDNDCPRDLNAEQHRLHTFSDWPTECPVMPEELARQGFFYLGYRDRVECAFCGGVLHRWEQGDDPRRKHESQMPQCPFIRGDATANIPIGCRHDYPPLTLGDQRANERARFHLQPISRQSFVDSDVPPPWSAPKVPEARWYGQDCGFVQREKGAAFIQESKKRFLPTQSLGQMAARDEETPPKHYVGGFSTSTTPCEERMHCDEETTDPRDDETSVGAPYDSEVEDKNYNKDFIFF
ncbi:hypothetical protein Bbelb_017520 [Branchiostoma belcheri]|nr:hypothetical protein Bbelb_017520 [Branchiostoma belcheri]